MATTAASLKPQRVDYSKWDNISCSSSDEESKKEEEVKGDEGDDGEEEEDEESDYDDDDEDEDYTDEDEGDEDIDDEEEDEEDEQESPKVESTRNSAPDASGFLSGSKNTFFDGKKLFSAPLTKDSEKNAKDITKHQRFRIEFHPEDNGAGLDPIFLTDPAKLVPYLGENDLG
eukprot:Colp12_sorted_trinity150504_noHs@29173